MLVAPPLFRPRPAWYQQSLPWIANQFSSIISDSRPPNLHLLPSPINQECAADGVSLTPIAGLFYVLHLFDQSVDVLGTAGAAMDQQMLSVREDVRLHDDRIAYLESRHTQLNHRVNLKTVEDEEFDDWQRNKSFEDWLTIKGLPRLSSDLDNRDWQVEAKRQVRDLIRLVLKINKANVNFEVLYVHNPTRFRKTGPTTYNVHLSSADSSKRIRELYSGFFRGVNPVKLPSSLKYVGVRNRITLNTNIRLSILRQLGERYAETNPGSSFKVRGFDPRPTLLLLPPSGSADSRARTLTYPEAIGSLPTHFSDEQLTQIFMSVGNSNRGMLRHIFLVLSDDDHDRCLELVKKFHEDRNKGKGGRGGQRQDQPRGTGASVSTPMTNSSFVGGSGGGMDCNDKMSPLAMLLRKPPPPPPLPCSPALSTPARSSPARKSVSFDPKKASSGSGRNGRASGTSSQKRHRSSSSSSASPIRSKRKSRSRRSRSSSSSSGSSSESESSEDDSRRKKSKKAKKSKK